MQPLNPYKKEEMKNLVLAMVASALILFGFEYYERLTSPAPAASAAQTELTEGGAVNSGAETEPGAELLKTLGKAAEAAAKSNASGAFGLNSERIAVESDVLQGSLALTGGRFDKLILPRYQVSLNGGGKIALFKPTGTQAHYFDAGWQAAGGVEAPGVTTEWQHKSGAKLTPETPVVLEWQNQTGQVFQRTFSLEAGDYAVRITDQVTNRSAAPVVLTHYAQVHKSGGQREGESSSFYNFFGPQGVVDAIKVEEDYDDLEKNRVEKQGKTGWWGISSQYFLAAIVPDQTNGTHIFTFNHQKMGEQKFYSAVVRNEAKTLEAGGQLENNYRLYAGPKKANQLAKEGANLNQAIDYGWFSFFSKPFFQGLMWLYEKTGNMGAAIILLTICIKILVFPLANKSYKAMQRMKEIQPKMAQLKEQFADDKERFGREMIAFYQREKINPASGCWPVLIQIPIFFAFYKMVLISFEFRHEPFLFWVQDLAAKDPFYVLPLLMGASMFIQMQLSPPPPDPVQRQVMKLMPIMFTVLFLMFPSGLVLYWLTNNVFSIAQQWLMMRHYARTNSN